MTEYEKFTVLVDEPSEHPALGFDDYATAFAEVIVHSAPRFAIGIFGDWGSGKTTLMEAIKRRLVDDPNVICVWFNAWRYEREEHLIVPMLDTLRESLATWAQGQTQGSPEQTQGQRIAATFGRAARWIVRGLSFRATVGVGPIGTAELAFDGKNAVGPLDTDSDVAERPQSFYHAAFTSMKEAIAEFVILRGRRIVVFVDDLDRCLPSSALEVLESMKLFFDLEGFVFVVGLDQNVIERAIDVKYQPTTPTTPATPAAGQPSGTESGAQRRSASVSGADYVKKIFQVPFGLPRINSADLRSYFDSLLSGSSMPDAQRRNLNDVVWRHLESGTGSDAGSVNPREVKRLINAYIIQMKLLSLKLDSHQPNPDVVLAIQTMAFRADWRTLNDSLTADSTLFVEAVKAALADPEHRDIAFGNAPLPNAFVAYFRGPGMALLNEQSLDVYLTSAETTSSSDPRIAEARRVVAQLVRRLSREKPPADTMSFDAQPPREHELAFAEVRPMIDELMKLLVERSPDSYYAGEAQRLARELSALDPKTIVARGPALLRQIDENLREMRRERQLGASSA